MSERKQTAAENTAAVEKTGAGDIIGSTKKTYDN